MGRGGSNPAAPFYMWSIPRSEFAPSDWQRSCREPGRLRTSTLSRPGCSNQTSILPGPAEQRRRSDRFLWRCRHRVVRGSASEAAELTDRGRGPGGFRRFARRHWWPNCRSSGDDRRIVPVAGLRRAGRAASLMIVAGLRDMTVSVNGAQFLRSAHQSCTRHGAFKAAPIYRVSGMFRGPSG